MATFWLQERTMTAHKSHACADDKRTHIFPVKVTGDLPMGARKCGRCWKENA